jgi:flagellar biosynthesis/type III secretory pathway protein FliH
MQAADVVPGQGRRLETAAARGQDSEDELDQALGFERGYADGLRQARGRVEADAQEAQATFQANAQAQLNDALAEASGARDAWLAGATQWQAELDNHRSWAESLAVELAFAAVTRLLGEQADGNELVARWVIQARREVGMDLQRVSVSQVDHEATLLALAGTEVVVDETLAAGSFVLHGPRGNYDTGIATRLDLLKQALLDGLAVHQP